MIMESPAGMYGSLQVPVRQGDTEIQGWVPNLRAIPDLKL